ncbi:UrcA family protein [Novosphingobium sp. Gsoil 351]|uniref:UrcA family protein n=1 Tax=Novosphingobium sp. Gsoil 351 TaxID=2675225 RepID=UPI0018A85CA2|nr:UrcA family protein [Novosphingobium sp. Gsoil 351]
MTLAAATFSNPVAASGNNPSVTVGYGDLQLTGTAGRKALDRRIAHAIEHACGVEVQNRLLAEERAAKDCVRAKHAEVAPQRAAALASRGIAVEVAAANR